MSDTFRRVYKPLSEGQKMQMEAVKVKAEELEEIIVIDTIKFPAVSSKEAGDIIREANLMLDKVSSFIREKSKGL